MDFPSSSFLSQASFWPSRTVTIGAPLTLQGRPWKLSCVPRSLPAFPSTVSLSFSLSLFCPYTAPKSLNSFFGHVSRPLVRRKTIILVPEIKLCCCDCQTWDSSLISQLWEFSALNKSLPLISPQIWWHFLTWRTFYRRYEQPKCDGNARAHPTKPKDHYKSRHLQGTSLSFTDLLRSDYMLRFLQQSASNCCHTAKAVITKCMCLCLSLHLLTSLAVLVN